MRIRELNDELMRTYHNREFKTDDLDDTHTQLQHTQDELVAARATSTTSRLSCMRGTSSRLASPGGAPSGVDSPGARGAEGGPQGDRGYV
jgi:hypothetical protein